VIFNHSDFEILMCVALYAIIDRKQEQELINYVQSGVNFWNPDRNWAGV